MWEYIEANWGTGMWGFLGLVTTAILVARVVNINVRNLKHMPDTLQTVAVLLEGTYQGAGLFGRRASVSGTFRGVPVTIDFPERWHDNLFGWGGTLAAQVWLRIRLTVPRGLAARVRRKHALHDLRAIGVPDRMPHQSRFERHVAAVLPIDGCDLTIRRGVATVRVPTDWDVAQLPSHRILALVNSANVVVQKICDACGNSTVLPARSPVREP